MASSQIDQSWYIKPETIPSSESSGGVIVRVENKTIYIAFIQEMGVGTLVLPKGHIEKGESPEEAARREIGEESGVTDLRMLAKLGVYPRLSFNKKEWKEIHYFLFQTSQKETKATDPDHDNDQTVWYPLNSIPTLFWPEQERLIQENKEKIKELINEQ